MPVIYLASASPRRQELIRYLGISPKVVVSNFDEASLAHIKDPIVYVEAAATGKAAAVADQYQGIVIGVDTDVVCPDGHILGKPENTEAAIAMLKQLSGRTHFVHSAIVLVDSTVEPHRVCSEITTTRVTFADIPEDQLKAYVATGSPFDKAGGYGMQDQAMAFVASIDGDPSNVIGLPLVSLRRLLSNWNISMFAELPSAE
jgi:septum formation protein